MREKYPSAYVTASSYHVTSKMSLREMKGYFSKLQSCFCDLYVARPWSEHYSERASSSTQRGPGWAQHHLWWKVSGGRVIRLCSVTPPNGWIPLTLRLVSASPLRNLRWPHLRGGRPFTRAAPFMLLQFSFARLLPTLKSDLVSSSRLEGWAVRWREGRRGKLDPGDSGWCSGSSTQPWHMG